jgi:hypothetical protein
VPAESIATSADALLFEIGVEVVEAVEGWNGNQEVTAYVAHKTFNLALVVAFGWTTEAVLEQIVGLQLTEDSSALSPTITQDPGHSDLGVVVHDALGNPAEEGKGCVVTITESFCGLGRISLHKTSIAVGQVNG